MRLAAEVIEFGMATFYGDTNGVEELILASQRQLLRASLGQAEHIASSSTEPSDRVSWQALERCQAPVHDETLVWLISLVDLCSSFRNDHDAAQLQGIATGMWNMAKADWNTVLHNASRLACKLWE